MKMLYFLSMEIEFHYFLTKGIALRAGFSEDEAEILAHASQLTDDNVRQCCINRGKADEFRNFISFTFDILKPRKTLSHIYPIFHFIPGDPKVISAKRKDGKINIFNTTQDSQNARSILTLAMSTGNLYRIGIAIHGFADTWAHQNFTGLYDDFNGLPGIEESMIPNICHADAKMKPDFVSYRWIDPRLTPELLNIDNNQRFMAASQRVFEELCLFKGKAMAWIERQWQVLKGDIDECFGRNDQSQHFKKARITKYKKILGTGNRYKKDLWLSQAVQKDFYGNLIFKKNYAQSHWFLFQQEIIKHQNETYKILEPLFETTNQKNTWVKTT